MLSPANILFALLAVAPAVSHSFVPLATAPPPEEGTQCECPAHVNSPTMKAGWTLVSWFPAEANARCSPKNWDAGTGCDDLENKCYTGGILHASKNGVTHVFWCSLDLPTNVTNLFCGTSNSGVIVAADGTDVARINTECGKCTTNF